MSDEVFAYFLTDKERIGPLEVAYKGGMRLTRGIELNVIATWAATRTAEVTAVEFHFFNVVERKAIRDPKTVVSGDTLTVNFPLMIPAEFPL